MSTGMSEAARKEQNEYQRKWRAANPDKVRERNRRYWEKRAARRAEEREREQTEES